MQRFLLYLTPPKYDRCPIILVCDLTQRSRQFGITHPLRSQERRFIGRSLSTNRYNTARILQTATPCGRTCGLTSDLMVYPQPSMRDMYLPMEHYCRRLPKHVAM